jgi:hypothetical protein
MADVRVPADPGHIAHPKRAEAFCDGLSRHRGAHVRFDYSIAEIAELVDSESAAFGISVNAPTRFNLAIERFTQEPFALVCPFGRRLLEREVVRLDDLICPLVRAYRPATE